MASSTLDSGVVQWHFMTASTAEQSYSGHAAGSCHAWDLFLQHFFLLDDHINPIMIGR